MAFVDASLFAPQSWVWTFGDGATSNSQNPIHVYQNNGIYSVKLLTTNANGSDSLTRTNYIEINDSLPTAASCVPVTTSACCNYGIYKLVLANLNTSFLTNAITTQKGTADYTCSVKARLIEGGTYTIKLTTGATLAQDTKGWIDFNNDGVFDNITEAIFTVLNTKNPTATFTIPNGVAVKDIPLRLRLLSDAVNSTLSPCANPVSGASQDFSVVISINKARPVANFTADTTASCNGVINFKFLGLNTISKAIWYFGDGSVDSTGVPAIKSHTYTTIGTYTIKLVVVGTFGRDTLVRTDYVSYVSSPVAASCIPVPSGQAGASGIGIYNFTLGSINQTSGGAAEGYKNYTCSQSTVLTAGIASAFSITVGAGVPEKVKVFLDANNNGVFEDTELLVSSNNVTGVISGMLTAPSTAVTGTTLRLRVIDDYSAVSANLTGCLLTYGQGEDYSVKVLANTTKPIANFGTPYLVSCNADFTFTDSSKFLPTSWAWSFGDGGTSFLQNPTHTYATAGTYTVKLIASNAFGSDSLIKTNYVTKLQSGQIATASCIPTSGGGSGYSVTQIAISNGFLYNNTNANTFYQDQSCNYISNVTSGTNVKFTLATNNGAPLNFVPYTLWIDWNGDGIFGLNERVIKQAVTGSSASVKLLVPAVSAITIVRMRAIIGNTTNLDIACGSFVQGQVVDLGLRVLPNVSAPVAGFSATNKTTCNGTIAFTDTSTNIPINYKWYFGNGDSSIVTNPVYTYSTPGLYTVTLISSNAFGADTITKTNYITVSNLVGPKYTTCLPVATQPSTVVGIFNFKLGGINKASSNASEGYKDFTCSDTTRLFVGANYPIKLQVSTNTPENVRVFLDLNNDGTLDASEVIFTKLNFTGLGTGFVNIPATAVLNKPLRLRVIDDYSQSTFAGACGNMQYGQAEDYTVTLAVNTIKPGPSFSSVIEGCSGVVTFTDSSTNFPTTWLWSFGDGTTDTLQNPSHTYTTTGVYTVKLKVCNSNGCDSTTIANAINITNVSGPKPVNCKPGSTNSNAAVGIRNVSLNTINQVVTATPIYQDFSCITSTDLYRGNNYTLKVTTGPNNPENVRVYIDLNNDGIFQTTESVLSSANIRTNHTGIINIPNTFTILNKALRMRVISDIAFTAINDACTNRNYGKVTDFSVIVRIPTAKPLAKIGVVAIFACNGKVSLADSSTNAPTTSDWQMGDGTNRTGVAISHVYAAGGSYVVRLISSNSFGSDTIFKTILVPTLKGPKPLTACNTTTQNVNQAFTNISINTINKNITAANAYLDYTCSDSTKLILGQSYNLSASLQGNFALSMAVWVDYNNDGVFQTTELVFSQAPVVGNRIVSFIPPSTAVINKPLRLRVMIGANGGAGAPITDPCGTYFFAQWVDFTVNLKPVTTPPVANFKVNKSLDCYDKFTFKDSSSSVPTTWAWSFGDGTFSAIQNPPQHSYTTAGAYQVKLVASNAFGIDSITKTVTATSNINPTPIAATCKPNALNVNNPTTNWGTRRVRISQGGITKLDKSSGNTTEDGGNADFTCQFADLAPSSPVTFVISVGNGGEDVAAYLDYNNNGTFETNERILSGRVNGAFTSTISLSNTFVANMPLRLRIVDDRAQGGPPVTLLPCQTLQFGQAEDYTIMLTVNGINNGVATRQKSISAYPNPSKGNLTLDLSAFDGQNTEVTILNTLGQVVIVKNMVADIAQGLDISQLPNGVYLLKAASNGITLTTRVTKQ